MTMSFRINNGTTTERISGEQLDEFAKLYGLDESIPGQYSSLFVLNLLLLDKFDGISPFQVLSEVNHLEGRAPSQQTKPASEFTGSTLKGLWHKHFLPTLPSTFAHNIKNHFGKNGLKNLIDEIFDPSKNSVVTQEMINELSHRVVEEPIVDRGAAGKLTGEWIIFAKEAGQNYYLCICPHTSGDENIASNLKNCLQEFPFLSKYVS